VLKLDIRENGVAVRARMAELQRKHLPAATVEATNRTGRYIHGALRSEMAEVFDRPTPWALRGLRYKLATASQPIIRIWLEEWGGKGIPPAVFLRPQIEGGTRRHKRFERALIVAGIMRSNEFAMPVYGAPRDAYGNVPGPYIVRMLSDLQAFGEQGYRANRRGARRGQRRWNYWFAIRSGDPSGIRPGIYWSSGANVPALVFLFTRQPLYRKRFDFFGVGRKAFDRVARRFFNEALARHIRRDNR